MNRQNRTRTNRRCVLAGMASAVVFPSSTAARALGEFAASATSEREWWNWRGPNRNNIAQPGTYAPVNYKQLGFTWEAPVPGRGHSSPIVVGDLVLLSTADKERGTQSVLAYARADGKQRWSQVIHQGGIPKENHRQNTEASPTMAYDGERLFVAFYNSFAIWLTALNLDGKVVWQKSVGQYNPQKFKYGYAASPAIYKDMVIVAADYDGDAFVAGLDQATGKPVWKTNRSSATSFSSPIVAQVGGRDQLVISGNESLMSYDPNNGKKLWSAKCLTMATCGTVVWDEHRVFASGGYPKSETVCVRADGSAKIEWTNAQKCYEQSMLYHDGYVYAVTDPGVAYCWRATDGETMWKNRLGGKFSCSPLLVGDAIHILNEAGEAFAFRASPSEFKLLSSGKIADEAFATPAAVGDTMFMRLARNQASRQEFLAACRRS